MRRVAVTLGGGCSWACLVSVHTAVAKGHGGKGAKATPDELLPKWTRTSNGFVNKAEYLD